MLKLIDPLIDPDLLHALAAMGHGDRLALVDANFPADSVAVNTVIGRPLRLGDVSSARAARAILSLLPLDTFVDDAALRMEVVGDPTLVPEVQREVQAEIDAAEARPWPMGGLERFAFYEAAAKTFAVVHCNERRFYGCFLFTKGVIPPPAV